MGEGNILEYKALITRDKVTRSVEMKIIISGPWKLYTGYSPDSIDFKTPLLQSIGSGIFRLYVSDSVRSYFCLVVDGKKEILAERHIPVLGSYNLRDLGGIKTTEGRKVKWGKLFRSDDLIRLNKDDLRYLSSIPIRSVIDFRSETELRQAPDRLPSSVKHTFRLSIDTGNLSGQRIHASLAKENMDELMLDMNTLFITDPSCLEHFRRFFNIVQTKNDIPFLYHCSAGKDRTGIVTAFLLFALGVDEETVIQDYLYSNVCLENKYAAIIAKYPKVAPMFTVKREYLEASIGTIKQNYDSIEVFLRNELNVDIERLKELYLD